MADGTVYELKEYRDKSRLFRDRLHGGEVLAEMLSGFSGGNALLCALPAGGVPVSLPIAQALGLELKASAVSKITLPWETEAGYGAVAFDGTVRLNEELIDRLGLTERQIEDGKTRTREKVRRRMELLEAEGMGARPGGRTVIVVDDGLASGLTMLTAIEALRKGGAKHIVSATPTGHSGTVERLAREVEEIYCPNIRSRYPFAVAEAYRRWSDVPEEEAIAMLRTWMRDGGSTGRGMQ
jgi:predicted phosphoribosyltransferase